MLANSKPPLAEERENCRVCGSPSPLFFRDTRKFYKCPSCHLIFTNETADEKTAGEHYKKQWENADPQFWETQVDVLLAVANRYIMPEKILDFGSGSGAITEELTNRGYNVTSLEPMFHGYLKDQNYPHKFNVIFGVEVIEHVPNLWEELRELGKVLAPGGIMVFTSVLTNDFIHSSSAEEVFKGWWYKDDPTHVSFFCNESVARMAEIFGFGGFVHGNKVFVLKSPKNPQELTTDDPVVRPRGSRRDNRE